MPGGSYASFRFFESLRRRWADAEEARRSKEETQTRPEVISDSADVSIQDENEEPALALERRGKVAFLHVPGWTGVEDISRGVLIAEEAIRALVGSWEDGYRKDGNKKDVIAGGRFTSQHSELDAGVAVDWKA